MHIQLDWLSLAGAEFGTVQPSLFNNLLISSLNFIYPWEEQHPFLYKMYSTIGVIHIYGHVWHSSLYLNVPTHGILMLILSGTAKPWEQFTFFKFSGLLSLLPGTPYPWSCWPQSSKLIHQCCIHHLQQSSILSLHQELSYCWRTLPDPGQEFPHHHLLC